MCFADMADLNAFKTKLTKFYLIGLVFVDLANMNALKTKLTKLEARTKPFNLI